MSADAKSNETGDPVSEPASAATHPDPPELPAGTQPASARREGCDGSRTPLEAIIRGMDRYFIQQTLKRLRPRDKERKPS